MCLSTYRLGEIEDVLLSNEAPPSDDNVAVATEEGIDVVEKLHPSVKIGEILNEMDLERIRFVCVCVCVCVQERGWRWRW